MFGYLIPDYKHLTKDEREAYRAAYCGLCRTIGMRYGAPLRTALSYEMTYLALLLGDLNREAAPPPPRCAKHPFRSSTDFIPTPSQEYAADLTVLLLGAKCEDDVSDEGSALAARMLRRLVPKIQLAKERRPHQAANITASLSALSEMERAGCIRPELPAGCFGDLVGELMTGGLISEEPMSEGPTPEESPARKDALYNHGLALGKLLYLYDAHLDLKRDLKHGRYNPLTATTREGRAQILALLQAELLASCDALPLSPAHRSLIRTTLSFPL